MAFGMLKLAGDFHSGMAVPVAHCCDSITTASLPQFRSGGNRLRPNRHFSLCKLNSGVATVPGITLRRRVVHRNFIFICFASNDSAQSSEISSTAKIRSEVLSPFRSVRMFFYLAFVASGAIGGFIATARLIAALSNSSRAAEVPEILQGLAIDMGAFSLFAFLYYREDIAKRAQILKLSREESLSNLKLRVDEKKFLRVSDFRGVARLVILAGPSSFISECFKLSEPFTDSLVERGVLVVPFATDGKVLNFEENEEMKEKNARRKRLWQLSPVYVAGWTKWIDEQKSLANIPPESPVYLSLRMDGRVRGSGIGYPPWNALAVQLPLVKGMWSGLLDGMDGRV